jgi:lysophospholipase L1-like esterase
MLRHLMVMLAGLAMLTAGVSAQQARNPDRWEPTMKGFEDEARNNPPAPGQIVFFGSSTIRMWDLAASFPDLKTINRGFGGGEMADLPRYVGRVVTPLKPRVIVISTGGNDIERGASAEEIAGNFQRMVETVQKELPAARVVVFGVKPYPAIAGKIAEVRKTNALLRTFAEHGNNVVFIDVEKIVLGTDGTPRGDLFQEDGVHLTTEGYKLYTAALRPHLR